MKLKLGLTLWMLSLAAAASADAQPPADTSIAGIWSLGETRNCQSGPAWVFLADGYYAEVKLPNEGPFAIGLWKDEGRAIAYTHSHMPFPDMMAANEMKRLAVQERTPDKLVTRNNKGLPRIFHRCPAGSLKAPAGQAEH